jgi:hypothetical protein
MKPMIQSALRDFCAGLLFLLLLTCTHADPSMIGSQIIVSDDRGKTWTPRPKIRFRFSGVYWMRIFSVLLLLLRIQTSSMMDPVYSNLGYLRCVEQNQDRLYRTGDGGRTWARLQIPNVQFIHTITLHPGAPQIVYAIRPGHLRSQRRRAKLETAPVRGCAALCRRLHDPLVL